MAAIARKTPQIFGGSLVAAGNIAKFGSKAAGSPAYSLDPDLIQTARWLQGLANSLASGQSPYLQDLNGVFYVLSYLISYILERGMPEWDSSGGTNYYQYDMCRVNGTVYQCKVAGPVTSDPTTATNDWQTYESTFTGPNFIRAFAVFQGTGTTGVDCTLFSAFGVDRVNKVGTGVYDVYFTSGIFTDGNYGFAGSAGTANGATGIGGDNNVICSGVLGSTGIRTSAVMRVYSWEANLAGSGAVEDSGMISVNFFR